MAIQYEMDYEEIELDGKKIAFCILDEYDGVKQEVSLEKGILLLWHSYKEFHEEWFAIFADKESLKKYLQNQMGILSLMRAGKVFLAKRRYNDFNNLRIVCRLEDAKHHVALPEDVALGEDLFDSVVECAAAAKK